MSRFLLELENMVKSKKSNELVKCPHSDCHAMLKPTRIEHHVSNVHDTERVLISCPHCQAKLKSNAKLSNHIWKKHQDIFFPPNLINTKINNELSLSIYGSKSRLNGVKTQSSKNFYQSIEPEKGISGTAICPICNGDGGIRGGCYKCGGSGWVSDAVKQNSGLHVSVNKPDLSKISNANYRGNNVGATFRDRNGRIGSPVEHDDHSDEGFS